MLKQYIFIYFPNHYKSTSLWSCFNDLYEDSESFMKIMFSVEYVYGNVNFSTRTNFLQCHHEFPIARRISEQIYA